MRNTTLKTLAAAAALLLGSTAASAATPPCTDNSAKCLETIAKMYVEALLSHDGSKLPLADKIRRSENALTNAIGAHEVVESFARTTMVEGARDIRSYVDERTGNVILFFRLDIDLKTVDANRTTKAGDSEYEVAVKVPAGTYTVHETERFKVEKGYITEIEIIAHVEEGKGGGSGWPEPRTPKKK